MGPIEAQEDILSETEAVPDDGDKAKLVPVTESIRYRKRAQSAEKKVEALAGQLAEAKTQACEMVEQLSNIRAEQELTRKLIAAGTIELEAAVAIAKARLEGKEQADFDGVIEQLKKEKQYLFAGRQNIVTTAQKTAAAKDRMTNKQTILERAAKRAATTGNRTDLQEYLKLRRNFV